MDVITALIVFALIVTALCVKARAAGPALVSGALALLLICSIASDTGIPGAVGDFVGWVGQTGSDVAEAAARR